jgi:predicted small lipoprotein YifL
MKTLISLIAVAALVSTLAGCEREGPAEKAGRQVDRAADKAARSVEKAGDNIRDAVNGKK